LRCLAAACILVFTMCAGVAGAFERSPTPLMIDTSTGSHSFSVELALTPAERGQGLMHRAEMPADQGMLFDFGAVRPVAMWMKNTLIPLDMVFIKPNGVVHAVAENTEPHSLDVVHSGGAVRFVLEVNAGVAARIGLQPGDVVHHPAITATD